MIGFLRKNRDFTVFLTTQASSNLGDSVRALILPLLVLQATRSAIWIAGLTALGAACYFLSQLPLGALLDRWDRRRAMLLADIGRAALILAVPVAAALHGPVLLVVGLVVGPLSLLSALFAAGAAAVTPSLVDREDLTQAFGLFEAAESAAWIAGPLIAGLLVGLFGAASALGVDALSFLISALGLATIRLRPAEKRDTKTEPLIRQMIEGLRFVLGCSPLREILFYWTLYGVIGYGAITALIYVASSGGGATGVLAGPYVSAYAGGSLAGTLLAGRRTQVGVRGIWLSLAVFGGGALLAATNLVGGLLAGAALIGAGEGFFLVLYLSRRAGSTPEAFMGRIGATAAMLANLASSISVGWVGLVLDRWKAPAAFTVMGVLAFALAGLVCIATMISPPVDHEPVSKTPR